MKKLKKKKDLLVSIILPVYNSSDYLFQTINSVICQTYTNWELLIIDDNSFDGSVKILKYFKKNKRVKVFLNKKNKGPDYCRNVGLNNCKGEYIAFLDSDDVWSNSKLEKQLRFMKKKKLSFTCTNYIPFNERFKLSEIQPKKIYNQYNFIYDTSIATSTVMIKKISFPKIKFLSGYGFDDYVYKKNLLKFHECYNLNIPLTFYRMRVTSISSSKFRNIRYVWKINKLVFKFNFMKNILSICMISFNSFKKYNKIINSKKKISAKDKEKLLDIKKKCLKVLNGPCGGPKVSIIMPSYNSANTLNRALNSIFKQNYKNWELIFVDDGSTDNTKRIIKEYNSHKIKYFKNNQNKGQAFSRNYALKMATGKYIAFLDSDDEWHPNKLEHQINYMKSFNLDFSYTNYIYVIKNISCLREMPEKISFKKLLNENIVGQSTVVYEKKKYEKYNFSTKFRMDYYFWLKISKKKKYIYGLKDNYCTIYSTDNSLSQNSFRNIKLNWVTMRDGLKLNFLETIYNICSNSFHSFLKKQLYFIFHK